jgi:transmembrane sensor
LYQERIIQLLTRKLASEATEEELLELDNLMRIYPDAVYYEETLSQLWQKDDAEDDVDVDSAFEKHQLKYKDDFSLKEPVYSQRRISNATMMLFGLIFMICLSAGFLLYNHYESAAAQNMVEISAGEGIRKKILLPDSTRVWLNSNSKLVYDSKMLNKAQRSVKLIGEAYFDVTKDKEHPFIIETGKYSIKVLGTAFNVRAYPGELKSETTLIHGLVELSLNGRHEQKVILKPNEKFSLTQSDNKELEEAAAVNEPESDRKILIERVEPVLVANKEYIEETAWTENQIVFKNETFDELIPKFERWYNVKIKVRNRALGSFHFTGAFHNESITEALKAMQLIKPFKFKITQNEVEIF